LRTTPAIAKTYRRSEVKPGDLVFSLRGNLGEVSVVPPALKGANLTQGTARIRVSSSFSSGYFKHLFQAPQIRRELIKVAKGSTFQEISLKDLRSLNVPVPPRSVQDTISNVIDAWEQAIEHVERTVETKRERKRGLMQVLLTGKKRLTEYSHLAWRSAPLAEYVASSRKGKPASLNDAGRGVPYIGSAAFDGSYTSHTDDPSAVRCGAKDVLLLWDGEYAGKSTTGHVGAVGSTVVAVTLKAGLDHVYLHNLLLLHNQRIRSIREGSGIPHMPGDFFNWFRPHLPPIEEQRKIASVLSTADEELRKLEAQLEGYELQKRGLLQQLLTGKKRMKVEDLEPVPG
jgi:type I restriction enzyme S subunit